MQVRREPATTGSTPSNTRRPARSSLNPRYTRSRSTRPLCEMPKPSAWRTRGCPCGASGLSLVAQKRNDVADRRKADTHHDRIARAVDELKDRTAVEARAGRPRDLDMAVIDLTPSQTRRYDARNGLARPHRQGRASRGG